MRASNAASPVRNPCFSTLALAIPILDESMRSTAEKSHHTPRKRGNQPQIEETDMIKIVWNGCDGYVETYAAEARGYDFDGEKLHTQREIFIPFDVEKFDISNLPEDEDGGLILPEGVFITETGNFYRAV